MARCGVAARILASLLLLKIGDSRLSEGDTEQLFKFKNPSFKIEQPSRKVQLPTTHLKKGNNTKWNEPDSWLNAVLNFQPTQGIEHHNQYIVNFGAHYEQGIDDIVSYVMQSDKIEGFACDSDDGMTWAGAQVSKYTGFVTTANVRRVLKAVPR